MAREAQIIGSAVDIWGERWDVREALGTTHGFDVLTGWPADAPRGRGGRGVAIIMTMPLAQYLHDTPRPRDIVLPIGSTTVKRLRAELDLSWDWDAFWLARRVDLMAMTLEDFCRTHGVSMGAASQRRAGFRSVTP